MMKAIELIILLQVCLTSIKIDGVWSINGLSDGDFSYNLGKQSLSSKNYIDGALYFWTSILLREESGLYPSYTTADAFENFLSCFRNQEGFNEADGYAFIGYEYHRRNDKSNMKIYLNKALDLDPKNRVSAVIDYEEDKKSNRKELTKAEQLYYKGNKAFEKKELRKASEYFERSCKLSNRGIGLACANAIYCRINIAEWGENGMQFKLDIKSIEQLTREDMLYYRSYDKLLGKLVWSKSSSLHPHSMLGYPLNDLVLKKHVAESVAGTDLMYGMAHAEGDDHWREKIPEYTFDQNSNRRYYQKEAKKKDFRIRVGYVSAGFSTKAVIILAQDILRFHDKSKFEVHVFSTGEPDKKIFIEKTMRGVDMRERIKTWVDKFHDVQDIHNRGPGPLAKYITQNKIHVLIDWDGYCRNGIRAQGLYSLRPAPVQIIHQEYLSTSGGNFDYLVSDEVVSPSHFRYLYSEKLMLMPNHFFSKGHAMQKEFEQPKYQHLPAKSPNYDVDSGTPQHNQCGSGSPKGQQASFVFCNFNKFLKFSPHLFSAWLRILQQVPDSILCLLEYPKEGVGNLKQFIHQESNNLLDRVYFLPWVNNPFDHQRRHKDLCNAILDSHPYNGHTTTMDALYAGVPVITRSDGLEMSSLVTTSANINLGLTELNAYNGLHHYEDIAVRLASSPKLYKRLRKRLIDTSSQQNPMHPFWDMKRYTRNFEKGLTVAFQAYLDHLKLNHLIIEDVGDDYDKEETHDDEPKVIEIFEL